MYVNGYTKQCDSEGTGGYVTTLSLPMKGNDPRSNCGITVIQSVGDTNRYVYDDDGEFNITVYFVSNNQ